MIRSLNKREEGNIEFLHKFTTNLSIIILTPTGLEKSILDATYSVRLHLKNNDVHDYDKQSQGQENKIILKSYFFHENFFHELSTSLYRPQTKDGDPRIWFLGLKKFVQQECALALVIKEKEIFLFNLSIQSLESLFVKEEKLREFLESTLANEDKNAVELIRMLKKINRKGWIPAVCSGDTAVGATLEKELGIKTNSSKKPDYKGIEIKAYRSGMKEKTPTRSTLFAQVPDWDKSKIKSSKDMLEKFGYNREGRKKLYCTVKSKMFNSQGLSFKIDERNEFVVEYHKKEGSCLNWSFKGLIERLKEKHNATFWVEANSRNIGGKEEFQFTQIIYTRSPIVTMLIPLIENGIVTMDHLIAVKKTGSGVVEKGPLFKMDKKHFYLIFPERKVINLKDVE